MAREEPVGRPLAEAAQRDEPRLHLVVRQRRECGEIELRAGEPDDVLRLAPREADRKELVLARARDPLAGRKRPRHADLRAEALDQPVPDRGRGEERHLLRGDRADEHLERVGDQRRPESDERRHELAEHLVAGRPGVERLEVEREPDERAHDRLGLAVERLGVDAAGRRLDAQLASADDAVQAALVPHARAIDPERAKALGGEREVEWSGTARNAMPGP